MIYPTLHTGRWLLPRRARQGTQACGQGLPRPVCGAHLPHRRQRWCEGGGQAQRSSPCTHAAGKSPYPGAPSKQRRPPEASLMDSLASPPPERRSFACCRADQGHRASGRVQRHPQPPRGVPRRAPERPGVPQQSMGVRRWDGAAMTLAAMRSRVLYLLRWAPPVLTPWIAMTRGALAAKSPVAPLPAMPFLPFHRSRGASSR